MYKQVCRTLLENGARLIYTANRALAATLKELECEYQSSRSEISLNEKIAFEIALAGAYSSKRTACIFPTEGLYEALDPLMSSAYTGVIGGFLIVCLKEIEEDITPIGPFSKLPIIITENEEDFKRAVAFGYDISERYEIPVIVQAAADSDAGARGQKAREEGRNPSSIQDSRFKIQDSHFTKNPSRWAATPKFRYQLHRELNEKVEKIREEFEGYDGNVKTMGSKTGIITDRHSGLDFFDEDSSMLFVSTVYPLPLTLINGFMGEMDEVFISEGPYPAIELQIHDRSKIISEKMGSPVKRTKPQETMYGFDVVRDTLGPASSINMAHGIKKTEPDRRVLAITFEAFFLHSGMPAFVNTLYNASSYVLLILGDKREEEIKKILAGFGFLNAFHIDAYSEIERFKDVQELTVLFCKGII
jgi:TPP-dependent indolepyruvate ferredoxin oxidoreductase alpha subunit